MIPNILQLLLDWENNLIDKSSDTELCKLYQKYGSDKKGKPPQPEHNFPNLYIKIFEPLRDKEVNIFELGLGTNNPNLPSNMTADGKPGASLYAMEEYFSKASIFGADIDTDILFDTDRIKTFYCDQRDPDIINAMWENDTLRDKKMHVIIEDGLHTYEASYCFLVNSLNKLVPGGVYFGEDQIEYDDLVKLYEPKIDKLLKIYDLSCFKIIQMNKCAIIVAQKNY